MNGSQWFISDAGELFAPTSISKHYSAGEYERIDFSGFKMSENPQLAKVLSKVMKLSNRELKELCEENVDWFL